MQYRTLGKTGLKVSALGFGASSLGGVFRPVAQDEAIAAVHAALDLGINYLDVSPYYGLTRAETVLGQALRDVARERYLISTKVGRYGADVAQFDFSAARVAASIDESLGRLGLDHVDLLLAHDIEYGDLQQVVQETLPALGRVVQAGKARFIGVTGLPLKVFRQVLAQADIDVILSYCHYQLNDTALAQLLPLLQQRQVGTISASPLGMGLLSTRGVPAWHPAPPIVQQACAQAASLCRERGKSIETLAIQFALARPEIASTLVGSASPRNMQRNIQCLDEPMDHELLAQVQQLLTPVKNLTWPSGRPENN